MNESITLIHYSSRTRCKPRNDMDCFAYQLKGLGSCVSGTVVPLSMCPQRLDQTNRTVVKNIVFGSKAHIFWGQQVPQSQTFVTQKWGVSMPNLLTFMYIYIYTIIYIYWFIVWLVAGVSGVQQPAEFPDTPLKILCYHRNKTASASYPDVMNARILTT